MKLVEVLLLVLIKNNFLGPMLYGCAFWRLSYQKEVKNSDFNDSKALSPSERERLFEEIKENKEIGYVLRVISAKEISANMLKPYFE